MATSYQRRPDGRLPEAQAVAKRDPSMEAELHKLDEQKRALEQRGEKGEKDTLDPELAARLQPSMGNAALAGLLNRATDTASASGGDTALEEKRAEDQEKEEEGEEREAGEVEHVLPSFSTGGGGGGGQPPWAMARQFGGDDDEVIETIVEGGARWRPMPMLPDPDDDAELEDIDEDDSEPDPDALDPSGADAALGGVPWRATVLSRGLRHAQLLTRPGFGPETLVDADGLDQALGRARAMLRFVARAGDGLDAALIARAATGSGEAVFAPAGGFSGATARALGLVEIALASQPPGWAAVLDVVAEPRARARVENVAERVAQRGGLSASVLFEVVLGARFAPIDVELSLDAHPAAVTALSTAAGVCPLPLIDTWTRPEPRLPTDRAVDGVDAILARFTGAPEPQGPGLVHADLAALFESMSRLLGAIGASLVEIAAAGVAAAPHADPAAIVGILGTCEAVMRRAARRLYAAGEAVEALIGTEDEAQVRALAGEARAVRSTVEVARQGAISSLARLLIDTEPAPPELPPLYAEAEVAAGSGRSTSARALLEAAVVSAPPELEGRVLLAAAGLSARLGFPEIERFAEAGERLGGGLLAVGARALSAGLALARERWDDAEREATVQAELAERHGLVYALADAACTRASARARRGDDWRPPLLDAAASFRRRDEGGALNLLKARWAELAAEE